MSDLEAGCSIEQAAIVTTKRPRVPPAETKLFVMLRAEFERRGHHAAAARMRPWMSWSALQQMLDETFPAGFKLRLIPVGDIDEIRASINRKLVVHGFKPARLSINEKMAQKGLLGRVAIRDLARDAGRLGGLARRESLTKLQRQRIARRAAQARWRLHRSQENANAPS